MNSTTYKDLIAAAAASAELEVEGAKIDFALGLARLLEMRKLSKTQLAQQLGVSKPMVTRILRGDANLTIETMVRAVRAGGGQLHLHIAPEDQAVQWFRLIRSGQVAPAIAVDARMARTAPANPWNYAANDHEAQSLAA